MKIFIIIFLFIFSNTVFADDCILYEPAIVTIYGTLSIEKGYGPPGFGEDPVHDQKEEYPVLSLDSAICINGGKAMSDNKDVSSIKYIQIISRHHFDQQLVGAHVAVSGSLTHRISGGHTDVLIRYTDVQRLP